MHITETALARQHMTADSRVLFRDSTLDTRLGRGTIAGALNDQVRIRFDKVGQPSQWGLIPDNKLSADLLASPAGPKLEAKLRAVLASANRAHDKGTLDVAGVMLSPDETSWAAGYQLMMRDVGVKPMSAKESLANGRVTANLAAAQAIFGWVQISPSYSRNILTSIGAYSPETSEIGARSGLDAQFVGPMLRHELEHRVTGVHFDGPDDFASYAPVAWLEEGTATILHMVDRNDRRAAQTAWDVTPQQHAGHVGAPDSFNPGWKPWAPASSGIPDFSETGQRNYVDSIGVLKRLLTLAGVDRRTKAGDERTQQLLQDVEVRQVPTRLATAILRSNDIRATKERVANLTDLVIAAIEPDGVQRVEAFVERLAT